MPEWFECFDGVWRTLLFSLTVFPTWSERRPLLQAGPLAGASDCQKGFVSCSVAAKSLNLWPTFAVLPRSGAIANGYEARFHFRRLLFTSAALGCADSIQAPAF